MPTQNPPSDVMSPNGECDTVLEPQPVESMDPPLSGSCPKTDATPPPKVHYSASIYPGPSIPLPDKLASELRKLEVSLKMPLWLLVHGGGPEYLSIDEAVFEAFFKVRQSLGKSPVALLIDSPGGDAEYAYRLAMLLRRECRGFVSVVPRYAKSAGTLLAIGGHVILLDPYAELGPIDAQLVSIRSGRRKVVLDEVQSIQRLHARALECVDQAMFSFTLRTDGEVSLEKLLPMILTFEAELMRPLMTQVDAMHFSEMSRLLKVAQEYAIRLLSSGGYEEPELIARLLVESYPEHGFVIDDYEARKLGLRVPPVEAEQLEIMDAIRSLLPQQTILGRFGEMTK